MHDHTLDDLLALIRSRIPLVQIETFEEKRIVDFLGQAAAAEHWDFYLWTAADGLTKHPAPTRLGSDPTLQTALRYLNETINNGVIALIDVQPHLTDLVSLRLLKEIAQNYHNNPRTALLIDNRISLPQDLARLGVRYSPKLPDTDRIHDIYLEEAYQWLHDKSGDKIIREGESEAKFLETLRGTTEEDARLLTKRAIQDGRIAAGDINQVVEFKRNALATSGLAEFVEHTENFESVGGLEHLKTWLQMRRDAFINDLESVGLTAPKAVLLLGVQGVGKSLAAKAIAGNWGVPLIRLDFGALYNKFLGDTERNLRQVLTQAEAMAPCVLWIDEIEKGLATDAGGVTDGGVSRRLLGTVLTWMAEHTKKVFMVATSNDISQLPPELIRKGRIDEIFFVDLPGIITRQSIFRIHLKKRNINTTRLDVRRIAELSEGFSGSEIEQVIVAALFSAYAVNRPISTEQILDELKIAKPLSVIMREKVSALRSWASGRTVAAN